MTIKVYKRTDTARNVEYQDGFLAAAVPGWPDVPIMLDEDRDILLRPTTRKEKLVIYAGSFALFSDDERDMDCFLRGCKLRKITLIGVEENYTWTPNLPLNQAIWKWLDARKHGAAMRGARKSAETKKANTAAAMKLIEHELASTDIPSKTLLAKVGIRAIGSIKNHYGFPREELQRRYKAEQKRKERREAYREQRAN
jgi:hypothetical protein